MIDIGYYERQIEKCKEDIKKYEKIIAEAKLTGDIEKRITERFFELTGVKSFITKSYYKEEFNGAFFEVGVYYNWGNHCLSSYDRPGKLNSTHPSFIHLDANDVELNTYVDKLVAIFVDKIQDLFTAKALYRTYEEHEAERAGFDFESYIKNIEYRIEKIISGMLNPDTEKVKDFIHYLLDSGKVVNHLPEYLDMEEV